MRWLVSIAIATTMFTAAAAAAAAAERRAQLVSFPDLPPKAERLKLANKPVLRISYGSSVNADRFVAMLNGNRVTNLFHPFRRPAEEIVTLPLRPGANVLELYVGTDQTLGDDDLFLPSQYKLLIDFEPPLVTAAPGAEVREHRFGSRKESEAFLKCIRDDMAPGDKVERCVKHYEKVH